MRNRSKNVGRSVGVLYILGTLFGILSIVSTDAVSSSSDPLAAAASNETGLALGAIFVLAMGSVLAMIPVLAYPVLSRVSDLLARGYVLFRSVLEAMAYLLAAVSWLLLIPLSSSADVSSVWGQTLFELEGAAVATTLAFLTGATMFYLVLLRGRLVPRWLSIWGLAAILPYLVPMVLGLFSDGGKASAVWEVPLAVQEMVLAVWLIVRGFNTNQIDGPFIVVEPERLSREPVPDYRSAAVMQRG